MPKQGKPERFGDAFPAAVRAAPSFHRALDLLGIELWIEDCEVREGNFGKYLLIRAKTADSGEPVQFSCGANNVMGKILAAKEQGLLPLKGKLVAIGRRYDIV